MGKQAQECQAFFSACSRERIGPAKFRTLFTTFHDRYAALHSRTVLEGLIKQTKLNGVQDPRVPQYVREMLRLRVVSVADVLASLLPPPPERSTDGQASYHDQNMLDVAGVPKPTYQAFIFQMLIVEILDGLLNSREEIRSVVKALVPWMLLFPASTTMGSLVVAVLSTPVGQETLAEAPKGNRKCKMDELRQFANGRR